jgi:SulP family sulfate permease
VIYIDVSGMDAILELEEACRRKDIKLIICGLAHQPYEMAARGGLLERLPKNCVYLDLQQGVTSVT